MKRILLTLAILAAIPALAQVTVVNMVPATRSGETNQDSEPTITINPSNPQQFAASAFTWDNLTAGPNVGALAPIWVSTNGGTIWSLVKNVPSVVGAMFPTDDITLHFSATNSGTTNVLYTGILFASDISMRVYRTNDYTSATPMTQLDVRTGSVDQPHVYAATALRDPGTGNDRLFVGYNDLNVSKSATIDTCTNADIASPSFSLSRLESRTTGGQDGWANLSAIHPDGTIYAAYYGWRTAGFAPITTDVVVDRDDTWAFGGTPFTSLQQSSVQGHLVATGVALPFGSMGQERLGSSAISIAVDPRNSNRVYLVWADQPSGTSFQTLHLRRSIDRGMSWSLTDLVQVPNTIGVSLAINSHGRVALMYQQFFSGTSQWETHVVRSTNADATTFDTPGVTLIRTSSTTPTSTTPVYLGDYAHILSDGRDFYGIFSASNYPDMANFPSGITFQRYANFGTHQLFRDAAMTMTVGTSIDPYFFRIREIDPANDFYVRDWTLGPGNADNGAEPSTYPYFYAYSDVWNRRGPGPGSFPSDQPDQEDAGNGAGSLGDNWAFARVFRRGTGIAPTSVNVHFLVSQFGTGSPYVDNMTYTGTGVDMPDPDTTVAFTAAGDMGPQVTTPYHWHLDATSSTHLCLAAEISVPGVDDIIAPSLVGLTPGWPSTDLNVINDNNKAQRNMGLTSTPSHGSLGSLTYYAIIHNIAGRPRTMHIRVSSTPAIADLLLKGAQVEMSGRDPLPFRQGAVLDFDKMQPGENRWLALTLQTVEGHEGEILPLFFDEVDDRGRAYSGFGIGLRQTSSTQALHDLLQSWRGFLARFTALTQSRPAAADLEALLKLLGLKEVSPKDYLAFLPQRLDVLAAAAKLDVRSDFGTAKDFDRLNSSAKSGNADAAIVAHASLLNRLDALLTNHQLARGDAADIVPTLRWQLTLLEQPRQAGGDCAKQTASRTASYLRAIETHKAGTRDYAAILKDQLPCLYNLAQLTPADPLAKQLETSLNDPAALQHAHHELLQRLQELK